MARPGYPLVRSLLLFLVPGILTLGAASSQDREDDMSWLRSATKHGCAQWSIEIKMCIEEYNH